VPNQSKTICLAAVLPRVFARTVAALFIFAALWIGQQRLLAAESSDQPGQLVSGKTFQGRLTAAAEGRLTFHMSGERAGSETIPTAQLVRWGQFVESTHGAQLLLADGGLLVGQLVSIDRGNVGIRSDLIGEVTLPAGTVRAVLIHPPADSHRRDQLASRLDSTGNATAGDGAATDTAPLDGKVLDHIIFDNGDQLDGSVTTWNDDRLVVETDAGPVDLEAARVVAIELHRQSAQTSPPRRVLVVGLADGSRLSTSALVADAAHAQLTLAGPSPPDGAAQAELPPLDLKTETGAIIALQPLGGQTVYLSDLEPAGYKHIPFLQLAWPYRSDRNVADDLLRAGGKLFLKGLGMHSASRLTYDLDRPMSRLEGALAVDDRAGRRGSVVFRVFVDTGDGRWEPKFTSPTIRGGDPPVPMTVDLAKAKRISLLVEFADRGDELDYADWLDARLIP
jgi:NPCBM/NEW2 domain